MKLRRFSGFPFLTDVQQPLLDSCVTRIAISVYFRSVSNKGLLVRASRFHGTTGPNAMPAFGYRIRRLFRFRLRTLLVLLTISSIWIGLVAHHARLQRNAVAAFRSQGLKVFYDNQLMGEQIYTFPIVHEWLTDILGSDYFHAAQFVVSGDGRPVTDSDMALFAALPELKRILLYDCPISSVGLQHLERLRNVEILTLLNTNLTDESLAVLVKMNSLRSLKLGSTGITDEGLKCLGNLSNLDALELVGASINGDGFGYLRSLKQLEAFSLFDCPVSDIGLSHLASLPKLSRLTLVGTRITDAGLSHIASCPAIKFLSLGNANVSDDSVQHLATATSLQVLELWDTKLTQEGVAKLQIVLPMCKIIRRPRAYGRTAESPPL